MCYWIEPVLNSNIIIIHQKKVRLCTAAHKTDESLRLQHWSSPKIVVVKIAIKFIYFEVLWMQFWVSIHIPQ